MEQNLTPEQTQAIDLFVSGESTCFIAAKLGIGRSTLWRWRKLPAFDRVLRERQECWRDTMREEMDSLMLLALEVIRKDMQKTWSDTRVSSAISMLRLLKPDRLFAPSSSAPQTLPTPEIHLLPCAAPALPSLNSPEIDGKDQDLNQFAARKLEELMKCLKETQ